ncbi:hypothetical protein M0813_29598 [Anaeramoeba flamelloides]|uniref:Uncharacterized protein n=1 Tax=Anaeramoeba flamelloides TaxID=1746091 RepID=A0ABQ8XMS1_9EUKA|nr:hypothetical protein M0813_29598 [Anaeramoeba flamelloides]
MSNSDSFLSNNFSLNSEQPQQNQVESNNFLSLDPLFTNFSSLSTKKDESEFELEFEKKENVDENEDELKNEKEIDQMERTLKSFSIMKNPKLSLPSLFQENPQDTKPKEQTLDFEKNNFWTSLIVSSSESEEYQYENMFLNQKHESEQENQKESQKEKEKELLNFSNDYDQLFDSQLPKEKDLSNLFENDFEEPNLGFLQDYSNTSLNSTLNLKKALKKKNNNKKNKQTKRYEKTKHKKKKKKINPLSLQKKTSKRKRTREKSSSSLNQFSEFPKDHYFLDPNNDREPTKPKKKNSQKFLDDFEKFSNLKTNFSFGANSYSHSNFYSYSYSDSDNNSDSDVDSDSYSSDSSYSSGSFGSSGTSGSSDSSSFDESILSELKLAKKYRQDREWKRSVKNQLESNPNSKQFYSQNISKNIQPNWNWKTKHKQPTKLNDSIYSKRLQGRSFKKKKKKKKKKFKKTVKNSKQTNPPKPLFSYGVSQNKTYTNKMLRSLGFLDQDQQKSGFQDLEKILSYQQQMEDYMSSQQTNNNKSNWSNEDQMNKQQTMNTNNSINSSGWRFLRSEDSESDNRFIDTNLEKEYENFQNETLSETSTINQQSFEQSEKNSLTTEKSESVNDSIHKSGSFPNFKIFPQKNMDGKETGAGTLQEKSSKNIKKIEQIQPENFLERILGSIIEPNSNIRSKNPNNQEKNKLIKTNNNKNHNNHNDNNVNGGNKQENTQKQKEQQRGNNDDMLFDNNNNLDPDLELADKFMNELKLVGLIENPTNNKNDSQEKLLNNSKKNIQSLLSGLIVDTKPMNNLQNKIVVENLN